MVIESIRHRPILNSHVAFTTEFVVSLTGGACGVAASPEGETISIYEDGSRSTDPEEVVKQIANDGYLGSDVSQDAFDEYLSTKMAVFGRSICYALSLAFANALNWSDAPDRCQPGAARTPPRLCLNILNGGWHAYTNAVLSDFPEFLLVAHETDIRVVIDRHAEIQRIVKERLAAMPQTGVGGNSVSRFSTADNRECVEFLLEVLDSLGIAAEFDLMIDASAGDLRRVDGYELTITDQSSCSSEDFCDYWLQMLRDYPLGFLEDPLSEEDLDVWTRLATSQRSCSIIGDNLYSSDAARIAGGAAAGRTHGTIKPNQAGTVTAVYRAVEAAQTAGQLVITSHRSISTESPFVARLSCICGADYIKVGPLLTDYSSVIRLNEIIRLTGE